MDTFGRRVPRTMHTRASEAVARVMAELIADMVEQGTWRAKLRGGKAHGTHQDNVRPESMYGHLIFSNSPCRPRHAALGNENGPLERHELRSVGFLAERLDRHDALGWPLGGLPFIEGLQTRRKWCLQRKQGP